MTFILLFFSAVRDSGSIDEAYKISPSDPALTTRPFVNLGKASEDLHSRRMDLMGREVGISVEEYTYWQIKVK